MSIDTRVSPAGARRHSGAVGAVAALALTVAIAGCMSPSEPVTSVAVSTPTPAAPTSPPPIATASPSSSPSLSTQPAPGVTETDWGTIWDALPAGFPRYPGSLEAEIAEGAASSVVVAPADGPTVTTWLQAALEHAGFSTLSLSGPFEDGATVIESVGATDGCRVRTTVTPLSGGRRSSFVSVLYGAGCPPN